MLRNLHPFGVSATTICGLATPQEANLIGHVDLSTGKEELSCGRCGNNLVFCNSDLIAETDWQRGIPRRSYVFVSTCTKCGITYANPRRRSLLT